MFDYQIFIHKIEWEYIGAGSANLNNNLNNAYSALQRIAEHLNYHGLMMIQQTYVDKKIYFVV